ncbi:hypothetical protein [Streptomyces sp. NRRL S-350]|uniref:hypothetical protein n=1 Tax=Streptomyces sp. NRRL S-350 TaxID=1463902 RepID=UPI0004C0030E|nr:hypothetical protein [Streptomyces sp. NRRL S-350]
MSNRPLAASVLAATAVLAIVVGAAPAAFADAPVPPAAAATAAPTAPDQSVPVTPAAGDTSTVALATPSDSGAPATADTTDLTLDSYDQQSGRAVLAATGNAAADPGIAAAATSSVQPGRLIDSPPTAAAPHGALVAVTAVQPAGDGKVAVSTRPASLTELLGRVSAYGRTLIDPHNLKVEPLADDVNVAFTGQDGSGSANASAALHLNVHAKVPTPDRTSVELAGTLDLKPAVELDYQGATHGLLPEHTRIGFDLGAHANWHITAALHGAARPIRIPVAHLAGNETVMAGPLPIVITLGLTLTAEVGADGDVTFDAQQDLDGAWGFHAGYTKGRGWTGRTDPGTFTATPVRATIAGNASVRTGLIADGSVALYDAVGVKAGIEPYLRTQVNGSLTIDTSGAPPVVTGQAGLYAGLDVTGGLLVKLPGLGPFFEKNLSFPIYHNEWPLALPSLSGGGSAGGSGGAVSNESGSTPTG